MIRWTVACTAEDECLGRAEAPADFLSPREACNLARLTYPDRRRKWLIGRWAAKRLVREALASSRGVLLPSNRLTIANEPAGAPYAILEGEGRLDWRLSLSHRDDLGLAVLVEDPHVAIGADLELVESRDPALVRDFFTDEEAAIVFRAEGRDRDLTVARIWSAKESVLKMLGQGLRLDTRSIGVGSASLQAEAPAGWARLDVTVRDHARPTMLLWRDEGRYVLTIAMTT